ncbi:MAG: T9SS type A sorting domain-containing protein [Chitinophagales bacterium]|nr:T9SS type A sorting domain-containing protein [Chitinophagales bacterium]
MKKLSTILSLTLCSITAFGQWADITPVSTAQWLHSTYFIGKNYGFVVGRYWNGSQPTGMILKTIDGGANWNISYTDTMPELRTVFFLNNNIGFIGGDNGKVYRTTDGGNNWQLLNSNTTSMITKIYFLDSNIGFITAGHEVFKTTDEGNNWTLQFSSSSIFTSITFIDYQSGFIVGCVTNYYGWPEFPAIYKTINGGTTWTLTALLGYTCVSDISFPITSKGFAMGEEGLFARTIDTGTTWIQNNITNTYGVNSIFFLDTLTGYAVGRNYATGQYAFIIKTNDGGVTWSDDLSFTTEALDEVFFPTDTVGYAVGGSGVGVILKNDNGTFIQEASAANSCFELIGVNPNSATKKLNFNFRASTSKTIFLEVFNSLGQLMLSANFENAIHTQTSETKEIDISILQKGLYIIRIESECNLATRKIILE